MIRFAKERATLLRSRHADCRRKIDVIFLVEHIARELDVVTCVVAKLAAQFGIEAEVKSYYHEFKRNLETYDPMIVVFPFFYGADQSYAYGYLSGWPEAIFLNLAWEQILMKIDVPMKTPRDRAARERVHHICWTKKYHEFLSSHGVPLDHLPVTGNPAFKLYDLPYRDYFEIRSELAMRHKLDPDRKWVLFPESYQYAFVNDKQLRSLVEYQNADLGLFSDARDYSKRSLRRLLIWMNELRATMDPIFILRPRPSTPYQQVVNLVHQTIGAPPPNMAVIKSESVREWILAADHVVSSHSTTLIEAALAGKPIHMFSPEAIPEALAAEWHGLVSLLKDKDTFLQTFRQFPIGPNGARLAAWARTQFVGHDPLEAIAAEIARLRHDAGSLPQPIPSPPPPPDHRGASPARIAINLARKLLPRSRFDVFGSHDVVRRVSRWKQVLQDGIRENLELSTPKGRASNIVNLPSGNDFAATHARRSDRTGSNGQHRTGDTGKLET
jgi:surface carbohydrate biosynthesis protein